MMISVLERGILENAQVVVRQCRRHQLEQLGLYYNKYLPSPPIIVAHGLRDTAKLETILTVLEGTNFDHALVNSRECLSQRHLLGKLFAACVRALKKEDDITRFERVDSINALAVNLQKLFRNSKRNFVLIIDNIDKQRGASHTLLPALARLGDIVPALSIILTTSSTRQLNLQRFGVPHISFLPFTRSEAIQIVLSNHTEKIPASLPDEFPTVSSSILADIYTSFVNAVYDTLTVHTSSTSIPTFQRTCDKLWPRFIWPLLSEEPLSSRSQHGPSRIQWDFARLLTRNRSLFQGTGEKAMTEKMSSKSEEPWTFDQLIEEYQIKKRASLQSDSLNPLASASALQAPKSRPDIAAENESPSTVSLLKFFSTLLLLSCYLASHTPAKHDIILFSRLSSSSSHKKRYLSSALNKNRTPKKQRARKTPTKSTNADNAMDVDDQDIDSTIPTTPSKTLNRQIVNAEIRITPLEKEKTHKSSRLQFEKTSSIPRPFPLERVVAIVRAVHPDGLARTKGAADKVYGEMVELERLRLVVRLGTGANAGASAGSGPSVNAHDGGAGKGTDDGILEEKWRINASRDVVVDMGKRWGMGLEGWEID